MDGEFIEKEMKEVEMSLFVPDTRSDGKMNKESQFFFYQIWSQPSKAAHDDWSQRRSTVNCELLCLKTTNNDDDDDDFFLICDTRYIVVRSMFGSLCIVFELMCFF